MKRHLLFFLSLSIPLLGLAYDFTSNGIYYKITSSTSPYTVKVTYKQTIGCCSYLSDYSGAVVVPSTVSDSGKTYTVTSIGDNAFRKSYNLSTITIPSSVTSIGYAAFSECTGLNSVTIPSSIISIGNNAFNRCTSLTNIIIPETVEILGDGLFGGCSSLKSILLSDSLTSIGRYTFGSCDSLDTIIIPSKVHVIDESAFHYSQPYVSVNSENNYFTSSDGVLFNKSITKLFVAPRLITGGYVVPNTVDTILDKAFYDCPSLESLTLPAGLNYIGWYSFYKCTGLKNIYNYSVMPLAIDTGAFYYVNKNICILHVPVGTKSLYEAADEWKKFNIIEDLTTEIFSNKKNNWEIKNTATGVCISGLSPDTKVSVYTVTGALVQTIDPKGGELELSLPIRGVYILTSSTQSVKFIY